MEIQDIKNKYGVQQNDASDSYEKLKGLIATAKKKIASTKKVDGIAAYNQIVSLMTALTMTRLAVGREINAMSKEAADLSAKLDQLISNWKK